MSHPSKIDILARAKTAGFFVQFFFVGIDDPKTNVDRVELRVAQGGHDVPLDKIVTRWFRAMGLLGSAVKLADQSFLFDNSASGADQGPKLVLTVARRIDGSAETNLKIKSPPSWVRQYVLDRPSV
jgi:predicted ABC-type ATPase